MLVGRSSLVVHVCTVVFLTSMYAGCGQDLVRLCTHCHSVALWLQLLCTTGASAVCVYVYVYEHDCIVRNRALATCNSGQRAAACLCGCASDEAHTHRDVGAATGGGVTHGWPM